MTWTYYFCVPCDRAYLDGASCSHRDNDELRDLRETCENLRMDLAALEVERDNWRHHAAKWKKKLEKKEAEWARLLAIGRYSS